MLKGCPGNCPGLLRLSKLLVGLCSQPYHNGFFLSMAHCTRNMYEAPVFEVQSSGSFDEQRTYQQQQGFSNEEGVVEASDCMNGVLTTIPVSTVRLESGSEFEQPESSRAQSSKRKLPNWARSDEVVEVRPKSRKRRHPTSLQIDGTMQAGPVEGSATGSLNQPRLVSNQVLEARFESEHETTAKKSRKRRRPNTLQIDGIMQPQQQALDQASTSNNQALPLPPPPREKPTSFRLFKIARASEEYIIEQTMVETGEVYRYQLSVREANDGSWKVKRSKSPKGELDLSMVVEDSYPSIYVKDCEAPFHDRLQGWTFRKIKRPSGTTDTFYSHMGKQFRSLVEVSQYIVYSCYHKMVPIMRTHVSHEDLEAEAVQGMLMMISSAEVGHREMTKEAEATCSSSSEDDIFSNLPEIENLSTCVPNVTNGGGTVETISWSSEEDIFTSFPDVGNWGFYAPQEMEVEAIETRSTDEDDIFANLPGIEDLSF